MTAQSSRDLIAKSNIASIGGRAKYVLWEHAAIRRDYEFIPCSCGHDCWCRRHGCNGHYRLREITFEQFLDTYITLWIPPNSRQLLRNAVLRGSQFRGREKGAIAPLTEALAAWPRLLNEVRRCNQSGLCDGFTLKVGAVTNLYQAKLWSQLFYDAVVPFDNSSRARIKRAGYADPHRDFSGMNRELFADLRCLASTLGWSIPEIRSLDSASDLLPDAIRIAGGQPLSRILDKMFYSPGKLSEDPKDTGMAV